MTRFVLNEAEIAWRVVDEEAVIIHVTTSFYYSLNRPGTYLWNRLNLAAYSQDELAELFALHYHVETDLAETDTKALVNALSSEHLIVEQAEASVANPDLSDPGKGPTEFYEKPSLVKYEQLEKVLVSGE